MSENWIVEKACYNTINDSKFLQDYIQLTIDELTPARSEEIKGNYEPPRNLKSEQIAKLLKTASLFSLSKEVRNQKVAFKIAVYLLNQYGDSLDSIPFAVQVILTRLGDLPAIGAMVNRQDDERFQKNYKDYFAFFGKEVASFDLLTSYMHFPEVMAKKVTNVAEIAETSVSLPLTDFQSRVFFTLRAGKNVSFSAPTSAGKSYMVHNYIAEKIKESPQFCAVYIVPTRALIAEVQQSVRETTLGLGLNPNDFSVFVSANKLNMAEIAKSQKKVFVLTQERLQEAMSNDPLKNVNLLVVDEAQNVGHKSRGIILQDAVDDLIFANTKMQKLFIAPFIDNPQDFKKMFGIKDDVIPEQTSKSPVGQNIIVTNFQENEIAVSVLTYDLRGDGKVDFIPLGTFPSEVLPTDISAKKAWVASKLTVKDEPTIIYCNTPADCRSVAEKIVEFGEKKELSPALSTAIEFFSQQVHEDYYLCDALRNGVGYHYGRMPQFIKLYIKQLFEERHIHSLCCTSTLLEGVNLPAKNMVLYNPKAGGKMSRLSLLNLAGRAGRLMKDQYGKIFCINLNDWEIEESETVFRDKAEHVESSVDKTTHEKMNSLLKYLENVDYECPKSVKSLATSLIMKILKKPDGSDVKSFLKRTDYVNQTQTLKILKRLEKIRGDISLDPTVILKNRSFDPRLQDRLFLDLEENGFECLPFPETDDYIRYKLQIVFSKISEYLLKRKTGAWKYYGVLASNWILEMPYKEILGGKIEHNEPEEGESEKKFYNRMIEELDDDIEKQLRYEYTRGLKCYADIIRFIGPNKPSCDELPVFLEWGTYHNNTLLLLEIGLSRNVAIMLNEHIEKELGTTTDCLNWIQTNPEKIRKLPDTFRKEV